MHTTDYFQRLKALRLYSIERRFERYSIIYMWKIRKGIVINPGIEWDNNEGSRLGLTAKVPKYTNKLKEHSFFVKGPKLFNMLPKEIKEFPMTNPENKGYSDKVNSKKYLIHFYKPFLTNQIYHMNIQREWKEYQEQEIEQIR